MTPLEFLTAVWPVADLDSYYCIAVPFSLKGMAHHIFRNIEDAAAFVERVKTAHNVFFATHVLKQEKVWNLKRSRDANKNWVPGWSVRTQANMRYCQNFFFDLDVSAGNSKKYQSQAEAIQAIRAFAQACKLPRPMVVNSGGGVHVHFLITKPLASNSEWVTQATRLKQLAMQYGVKFDPLRTTDQSSVLRVAGAFNLKDGGSRPVVTLCPAEVVTPDDWAKRLSRALDAVDIVPAIQKIAVAADGLGSNIGPKVFSNVDPPPAEAIYAVCPQMARLRALPVKGHGGWWAGMGILQFSREGREACHDFTAAYPGYDASEVEKKCDDWKGGPTTCAKLNISCGQEFDAICQACPHVSKNLGPWSLARRTMKAAAPVVEDLVDGVAVVREIPDPPPPYRRTEKGPVEKLVENAKTGQTYYDMIHEYDIYPIDRMSDDRGQTETQVWRAHLPHDIVKDFSIAASDFVDSKALATRLANNGVYSGKFEELKGYMNSYIRELQRRHITKKEYGHFGWVDKDRTEFVLPHCVIKADGSTMPVNLGSMAKTTAEKFAGKAGTLQKQIELLKFYDNPLYVGQQFMILAALASPFFYATGHFGVIVSAYGESGGSKSTALYAGGSLYGDPVPYVVNGTKDGGTANFGPQVMQVLSNLPYMVDEISMMDAEQAKNTAYGVSQQGGKGFLRQNRDIAKSVSTNKSSISIFSTNKSLQSMVAQNNGAGQAAAVRVFEIVLKKADDLGVHAKWEAEQFLRELKLNYGHVGEYFMRKLMPLREQVEMRIVQMQKDLGITGTMSAEERFWFSTGAEILVICKLANKLGLLSYDYDFMKTWLLAIQIPSMRAMIREEALAVAPLTIITNYMEEKNNSILRMNDVTGNQQHIPFGPLLGHYDMSTPDLVLLKSAFKEYCERRNWHHQAILRELMSQGVVTDMDRKFTLGIGTDHAKGRSVTFSVLMTHPSIVKATAKPTLAANIRPMGSAPSNVVPLRPQGSIK